MATKRLKKIRKHALHFWETTQNGYNQTSWLFVVIAGSALLEQAFGLKGLAGSGVAIVIFYGIGLFHSKAIGPIKR
jgi:hypothetical protein